MGLSLTERELKVLVSFKELALKPQGIPDLPAQDLVDKVLKEVRRETGVQILPKIYPVDCRRLPVILRGHKLLVREWWHQVKRDDRNPIEVYHSIMICLGAEGDEVLTAQVLGWMEFFLSKKAMKVRGYHNPCYRNDERVDGMSVSLNLDCVKDAKCPEEGIYDLEWTPAMGLRYHKIK